MGLNVIEELLAKHVDVVVLCSDTKKIEYITAMARLLGYNIVSWREWAENQIRPALIVAKNPEDVPLPIRARLLAVTC
jgi:hypothetical protein